MKMLVVQKQMDLALALSSYSGVSTTILYLLAKLNCFMQRKATDFSKLPVILESILLELKRLKMDRAEWCSLKGTIIQALESEHGITLGSSSTRSGSAGATRMSEYRNSVYSYTVY